MTKSGHDTTQAWLETRLLNEANWDGAEICPRRCGVLPIK